MTALAALALALPLMATPAEARHGHGRGHDDYYSRGHDDHRGRGYDDRHRGRGYDDHRGHGYDRGYRRGYWDGRSHNGYWLGPSWYYGPPRDGYYARHDYRPGYRAWRRGDYLPPYYRSAYRPVDWRYYHLGPPPRGHHWVRDDRGDYLLVGIATGIIIAIAASHY